MKRRTFIKSLAVVPAVAIAPNVVLGRDIPTDKMMKGLLTVVSECSWKGSRSTTPVSGLRYGVYEPVVDGKPDWGHIDACREYDGIEPDDHMFLIIQKLAHLANKAQKLGQAPFEIDDVSVKAVSRYARISYHWTFAGPEHLAHKQWIECRKIERNGDDPNEIIFSNVIAASEKFKKFVVPKVYHFRHETNRIQ